MNANVTVGVTLFSARSMLPQARQRNLGRLTVNIRTAAMTEMGVTDFVDIYSYSVDKDKFEKVLAFGSALDITKGKARDIVLETATINYDLFDQLTLRPVE